MDMSCGCPQALDAALSNLSAYTDIAFTSRNGIHAVLQRLALSNPEGAAKALRASRVWCWALGADAAVLRAAGFPDVHTPLEVRPWWVDACTAVTY
jgi:uroporphyrinogen-III synthase